MMASPSELSLECKPHSHTMVLKSMGEQIDQTQKLEDFLARLEEERLKIDAFKRELPLCMQLLTNAMEASRQQLLSFRTANSNQGGSRPVLEEFIPLKHGSPEGSSTDKINGADNIIMSDNKANWMTSAQLWSQASDATNKQQSSTKEADIGICSNSAVTSPKLALDNKHRNGGGGAFLPFSKDRSSSSSSCPINPSLRPALPELALANNSTDKDMQDKKNLDRIDHARREHNISSSANKGGSINAAAAAAAAAVTDQQGKGAASSQAAAAAECQSTITSTTTNTTTNATTTTNTTTQTHRKARRCWSPDLHRRFVNALQMLGGSQVATPKQIRELMKVDGLTNDEVKSHLQKYRLHTRRPSPSPQATAAAAPQLVVLGGIWVPPEYATAAAHGGAPATLYGAHPTTHASPHYCAPPVPQEFYQAPTPPVPQPPHHHHHQLHHQLLHHQLHMYKPPSQAHSSPESDARGIGGRSESIEDGKSESSSWKADSENGGDKKALVLREDCDDSNGSEITLKF